MKAGANVLWRIGTLRGDDGRTIRDESGHAVRWASNRAQARRLIAEHNAKVPQAPAEASS